MATKGVDKRRHRLLTGLTADVGAIGTGFVAVPFVKSWPSSARSKAEGVPVEAAIGKIRQRMMVRVKWRGKAVYILNRYPEQFKVLNGMTGSGLLRNPKSSDWRGGYFRPCHGSKFDFAGRVFDRVPAQLNLEVPPHKFITDTLNRIGEDKGEA